MSMTILKKERVGVTLPSDLMERVDRIRGDVPRARFIMRAVEKALKAKERDDA